MIQIKNISKSFGQRLLFEKANFVVGPKERIGLVGRNGTGKSTLFSIIRNDISFDSGEVSIPKNYRIGSLDQHISFSCEAVVDEVLSDLSEEEKTETYRASKILFGLGFSDEDLEKDPRSFSGGFQVRINLAKVLVTNPSMLLLDEPTNYLDIVSLRWLKRFLIHYPGEILLITHDRDFMDEIATHIVGIHRGGLTKFKGNTEQYYNQMALQEENYEKTRINQGKKRKELESFVDRFRAKASKARQAQSRVKQLEKMETMNELKDEAELGLVFSYEKFTAKNILEVRDLSFSYSGKEEDLLFKDLSFSLGRNEKLAIIGKNGRGKSTLLNILAGELTPNSGQISEHPSISKGHFGQTNINRLSLDCTIYEEVQSANLELGQTRVRSICGSMMFSGEEADKPIKVLSGGERSRVMLGKIIARSSNILLLDEPTNHLDMQTIEILAEEIEKFAGAVIIVTHSEALLRRVANRLIVFRDGGAEYFWGGYTEFLEKIGWDDEVRSPESTTKSKKSGKKIKDPQASNSTEKKLKDLEKNIKEVEETISALENLQKKFEDLLQAKIEKGESVVESSKKIGEIEKKIEEKFILLEELEIELLGLKGAGTNGPS